MTRSVQLIRLLSAVIVATGACLFVLFYNQISTTRYVLDHPNANIHRTQSGEVVLEHISVGLELITAYGKCALVLPCLGLFLGVVTIWRWPKSYAVTELIVSALWVLSFLWVSVILLAWQTQNIPTFHGMRVHW
jgi:hypothetical protein